MLWSRVFVTKPSNGKLAPEIKNDKHLKLYHSGLYTKYQNRNPIQDKYVLYWTRGKIVYIVNQNKLLFCNLVGSTDFIGLKYTKTINILN